MMPDLLMRLDLSRCFGRACLPVVFVGAAALGACSDPSTGPELEGDVRVMFHARSGAPSASVAPVLSAAGVASAVQSVHVDEVAVVLGGVKLEAAGVDQTVDWVDESSIVVQLVVDGAATAGAVYDVAPGTYKELEVSIDKLEPGNPSEDPLIAEYPVLSNASVVASGSVIRDGGSVAEFSFAIDLDRDLEIDLAPFLEVEGVEPGAMIPPTVVSVVIDVGSWFADGAGGLLDPTDDAARSAIESNASASIAAFLDGDGDGEPGP